VAWLPTGSLQITCQPVIASVPRPKAICWHITHFNVLSATDRRPFKFYTGFRATDNVGSDLQTGTTAKRTRILPKQRSCCHRSVIQVAATWKHPRCLVSLPHLETYRYARWRQRALLPLGTQHCSRQLGTTHIHILHHIKPRAPSSSSSVSETRPKGPETVPSKAQSIRHDWLLRAVPISGPELCATDSQCHCSIAAILAGSIPV
jgi:hypothetical protein